MSSANSVSTTTTTTTTMVQHHAPAVAAGANSGVNRVVGVALFALGIIATAFGAPEFGVPLLLIGADVFLGVSCPAVPRHVNRSLGRGDALPPGNASGLRPANGSVFVTTGGQPNPPKRLKSKPVPVAQPATLVATSQMDQAKGNRGLPSHQASGSLLPPGMVLVDQSLTQGASYLGASISPAPTPAPAPTSQMSQAKADRGVPSKPPVSLTPVPAQPTASLRSILPASASTERAPGFGSAKSDKQREVKQEPSAPSAPSPSSSASSASTTSTQRAPGFGSRRNPQ